MLHYAHLLHHSVRFPLLLLYDIDHSQIPHHLTSRSIGDTEHSWCRLVPGGTGITVFLLRLFCSIPRTLIAVAITDLLNSHPLLHAQLTRTSPNEPFFFSIPPLPDPIIKTISLSPVLTFLSTLDLELNQILGLILLNRTKSRFSLQQSIKTNLILKELMVLVARGGGGEGQSGNRENIINMGIEDLIPKKDLWKAQGKI